MNNVTKIIIHEFMYDDYFDNYIKNFSKKYHLNYYFPYIKINEKDNIVLRIGFSVIGNPKNKMMIEDKKILQKILPIYYETFDLNEGRIIDVYYDKFINLVNNKKRQLKLQKINGSCIV